MKRKKLLLVFGIIAAIIVVAAILLLLLLPKGTDERFTPEASTGGDPVDFARGLPSVDTDEDTGVMFVNNELVVFFRDGTSASTVESLATSYGATVCDSTMGDLGIYVFRFRDAMTYRQAQEEMRMLRENSRVTDVHLNPLTLIGEDEAVMAPEATVPVHYPADPWGGSDWNMALPRDNNWGVEAIHAPAAWTYLDQLGSVKVGLIDSMPNLTHEDLNGRIEAYYVYRDPDSGRTETRSVTNSDLTARDHGTHVAGIMGAAWDNGAGLSGVTGSHADMVYATCSDPKNTSGYQTAYTYVAAIRELLNRGVCAINISQNTSRLIGFAASQGNQRALNHLQTQADLAEALLSRIIADRQRRGQSDFVICVAAGNNNNKLYYPSESATYGYSEEGDGVPESGGALALYNNFLNLIDDQAIRDRIIVVGAVGIDRTHSTGSETKYFYTGFSNIGDRVDIVAPGKDVYSCYAAGYGLMDGTSMATPHVTASAGLLFAAHAGLTGPQVKQLLVSTTSEMFYYQDGHSGLLDLDAALTKVLGISGRTPARPPKQTDIALDLCFVIDTTGSMDDDIDDARRNMLSILDSLKEKTTNYRVALVDYRDFSEETGDSRDYPADIKLDFTTDSDRIVSVINDLYAAAGGDTPETVYSALMKTLELRWRGDAKRMIIIIGDAPPKDPEPITGYTLDYVMAALYSNAIDVNLEDSDSRVLGDSTHSAISVYSIVPGGDSLDAFLKLSEATGGMYTGVGRASEVSDAIKESIDEMELLNNVIADFGKRFAGEWVDFYTGGDFRFSAPVSGEGTIDLYRAEAGRYGWRIPARDTTGYMTITTGNANAGISGVWSRNLWIIVPAASLLLLLGLILLILLLDQRCEARGPKPRPERQPRPRVHAASARYGTDDERSASPEQGRVKQAAAGPNFCSQCGNTLRPNAIFCPKCGRKVR